MRITRFRTYIAAILYTENEDNALAGLLKLLAHHLSDKFDLPDRGLAGKPF
jgi:hypothetical protein